MTPSRGGHGVRALLAATLLVGCGGGEPPTPESPLAATAKPSRLAPGEKGRVTATGGTKPYKFGIADNNTGTKISSPGCSLRALPFIAEIAKWLTPSLRPTVRSESSPRTV